MDIDLPEVVAEVKAAFERYEKALTTNDVAMLDDTFREDRRTIRYGGAEILYGSRGDRGVSCCTQSRSGLMRSISKTVITTYGRDFAVASTLFHRDSLPGKVGRQMQTWVRFPDGGWKVVAAHVSVIDEIFSVEAGMSIALPPYGRRTLAEELRLQTCRRDRARRAGARRGARRDGAGAALPRVAHAGARGDPPARRRAV